MIRVFSSTARAWSGPSGECSPNRSAHCAKSSLSSVERRHGQQPFEVVVRTHRHHAAQKVRPAHRDEQRDVAPVAVSHHVDRSLQVLDEGDGLARHRVIGERLVGVARSTVTTPVERGHAIALGERRADRLEQARATAHPAMEQEHDRTLAFGQASPRRMAVQMRSSSPWSW